LNCKDIQKDQLQAEQAQPPAEGNDGLGDDINYFGLLTTLVGSSLRDGMCVPRQHTALRRLKRVLSIPDDALQQLEQQLLECFSAENVDQDSPALRRRRLPEL